MSNKSHRHRKPASIPVDYQRSTVSKRRFQGRIVKSFVQDGREFHLHATKGWRSFSLAK